MKASFFAYTLSMLKILPYFIWVSHMVYGEFNTLLYNVGRSIQKGQAI